MNWHNTPPKYETLPLKGPDGEPKIQNPKEKAALLHRVLLSRHLEATDIPEETPSVASRRIPWQPFSEVESFRATCQVSSTSPGEDEITAPIIRLSWPILGERITRLFNKCAVHRVHPKIFKRAHIVILPKSGKRDRTLHKSYRPIALLSCLGKGLERLFARRLSFCSLKFDILGRDQCSAISRRSATDLTTALVCDVNEALRKGKIAGMVTVDVKGAFDGVLRNRLLFRLRTQGWPENVVQWVSSFFQNRSARIRLDREVSDPFQILCGLPQGSPVSPILFLLYVEPVMRLALGCFGYADDIAMFETGPNLEECSQRLQLRLTRTLQWGRDNGIQFETTKTELQYFHNKRKYQEPPLMMEDTLVLPNDHTRWLEIVFDRKLSFKEHIRRACQRCRVVTDHVKRLYNTVKGAQPALLRQTFQVIAFASLFYGAETWYGPKTSKWAIDQVQRAVNRAARAVLPVYKTTPVPALLRETGWAPATIWLERIHDRFVTRVASADPKHPLRSRWNTKHLQWIRSRQKVELSLDTITPTWLSLDRNKAKEEIGAIGREKGLMEYRNWEQS